MSEGRTIRLSSLALWSTWGIPPVCLVAFVLAIFAPSEPLDFTLLMAEPVFSVVIALAVPGQILFLGLFTGYPFTPRPKPGEKPPSARWGLRFAVFVVFAASFLALRYPALHEAAPTQKAVALVKKHAAASKALGSPIAIGWDVRGSAHPGGTVNDEPVAPSIDAEVPLHGPRGQGVLSVVGHKEGSQWVFALVSLKLDRGERIDVVGKPVPKRHEETDTLTIALIAGGVLFGVLLVVGLMLLLRSSDPDRAVASAVVTAGSPFMLRARVVEAKPHRLWIRFEVDYNGGEDGYGVTVEAKIQSPAGPPMAVELRIGDNAPAIGPNGVQNSSLYRVTSSSGPAGDSVRATAEIAKIPAMSAGAEVVVSGRVLVAEGQTPVELLVFLSPG